MPYVTPGHIWTILGQTGDTPERTVVTPGRTVVTTGRTVINCVQTGAQLYKWANLHGSSRSTGTFSPGYTVARTGTVDLGLMYITRRTP